MNLQQDMFQSGAQKTEAKAREFYQTPAYIVHQLLDTASDIRLDDGTAWSAGTVINGLPGGLWVDAGAGDGAIWSVCAQDRPDIRAVAIEIREAVIQAAELIRPGHYVLADWLAPLHIRHHVQDAAVVVMNPPFSLTFRFVAAAMDMCPAAWIWCLGRQSVGKPPKFHRTSTTPTRTTEQAAARERQRLKNDALNERRAFVLERWPEFKLQLMGSRPSFTGDGKTDSAELIWYGWSPTGRHRRYCRYEGPCRERTPG